MRSAILKQAVAKARGSIGRPPSTNAADRRFDRYTAFANAPGRSKGRENRKKIAAEEAKRLKDFMMHQGSPNSPSAIAAGSALARTSAVRDALEAKRAKDKSAKKPRNDKNNDGYTDGQKPKGAPRKKAAPKKAKPAPSNFRMEWKDIPEPQTQGAGDAADRYGRNFSRRRAEERNIERIKAERAKLKPKVDEQLDRARRGLKPIVTVPSGQPAARGGKEQTDDMLRRAGADPHGFWRYNQGEADRMAQSVRRRGEAMKPSDKERADQLARLVELTPKHVGMIRNYADSLPESERQGVLEYYDLAPRSKKPRAPKQTRLIKSAVLAAHIRHVDAMLARSFFR
ncbi:MAG: hypothetical protein EBZ50_05365 [Alphaproteobacteria bacterium]|nr:hypothetical protein [Alphaproteobacteria bacterium]